MFIIFLKFSKNKSKAKEFMEQHNEWIKRGMEEGMFLVVGSLKAGNGGAIVAHNVDYSGIEEFVSQDPFVVHDIVSAEIYEIEPKKLDERLAFLA